MSIRNGIQLLSILILIALVIFLADSIITMSRENAESRAMFDNARCICYENGFPELRNSRPYRNHKEMMQVTIEDIYCKKLENNTDLLVPVTEFMDFP